MKVKSKNNINNTLTIEQKLINVFNKIQQESELKPLIDKMNSEIRNCKCIPRQEFADNFHKFAGLISSQNTRLSSTADFIFICVSDSLELPVLTSIK